MKNQGKSAPSDEEELPKVFDSNNFAILVPPPDVTAPTSGVASVPQAVATDNTGVATDATEVAVPKSK